MLIKQLFLLTNDLAGTRQFYHDLLQVQIVGETGAHISFKFGNSLLTFFETSVVQGPFYHFAFSVPNNKLEEALTWATNFIKILSYLASSLIADFKGWNARAFYFHDNNQNILEFITHYDQETFNNSSFTVSLISGICEIGVVVPDVRNACNILNVDYHIPYFIKGPHLNDFSVMGDSNGMLVVSKTGRGWLPTQRASERYWTKLIIEEKTHRQELIFD